MVKKNKKTEKKVVTTILIVLLVLAVFVVIWLIVNPETHFKITKEECYYEEILVSSGEVIFPNETEEITILGRLIKEGDYFVVYYNAKREVCETKEVEEIYLKCFNDVGALIDCDEAPKNNPYPFPFSTREIKSEYKDDEYKVVFCGKKEDREHSCISFSYKKISKSDLSVEWLEENCECVIVKVDCPLGTEVCQYESERDTCFKYKCQFNEDEYFVETWEQIK